MAKKPLVVLGIDPGFGRTGYGLITAGRPPAIIDYGVIETDKDVEFPVRLATIADALENLIQYHQPAALGLEELFFCKNVTTAIQVGQARGVVLLAAARAHLPVYEINPMHVKQAVSSNGRATKQDIQKMVQLILNLESAPTPDDAADALAVALATVQLMKQPYA